MFFAVAVVFLAEATGTTPRAIGRGFGKGTFGLPAASAATAENPTASAKLAVKLIVKIIDLRAVTWADGITAFPDGESFNRSSLRSI